MTRQGEVPLVFLGPSCPAEMVRAVLPGAMIVPPVRRGDLYRYRLLNFGLFVLIDGVFSDTLAVSPREVVDVLEDGAVIVGASSMGALRAADCWPAGAVGQGAVYRLFRRGVLSSEDEVAVLHLPDRPWPPVTQALVTIRLAARHARRAGLIVRQEERALVAAAEALGYGQRSWARILRAAGFELSPAAEAALRACDIKRDDAIRCCRWVAREMEAGRLAATPRRDLRAPLGRLGQARERGPDPTDGEDLSKLAPEFLDWLWCAGHQQGFAGLQDWISALERADVGLLAAHLGLDPPAPDLAALFLRFIGHRRAVHTAEDMRLEPSALAEAQALDEVLNAQKRASWTALATRLANCPRLRAVLAGYLRDRALCLELRRSVLCPGPGAPRVRCPMWHRTATHGT